MAYLAHTLPHVLRSCVSSVASAAFPVLRLLLLRLPCARAIPFIHIILIFFDIMGKHICVCGNPGGKLCGKCKNVGYCSKECKSLLYAFSSHSSTSSIFIYFLFPLSSILPSMRKHICVVILVDSVGYCSKDCQHPLSPPHSSFPSFSPFML